jgi:hypothetical protein
MIHEWLSRLRFLLGQNLLRRGRQTHIDEELQFHQEQATAANLALGMTAAEARREGLIESGGVERAREQCHEQRPGRWIGTLVQDARYALRGFRRNPVFTIAVIATLALGLAPQRQFSVSLILAAVATPTRSGMPTRTGVARSRSDSTLRALCRQASDGLATRSAIMLRGRTQRMSKQHLAGQSV